MEPHTQTLFDSAPSDAIERRQDEERTRRGAQWFYLIAALSLVTSVIALVGGNWAFFASLGITQIIDALAVHALAPRIGEGVKIVAFVLDVLAAGIFALMGFFASKRNTWAFVAGMALYLLDALLFIAVVLLLGAFSFQAFIVVAFHAYVLWSIYGGYKACARLAATGGGNSPPSPPPVATPV
jgi:hypothetical protein